MTPDDARPAPPGGGPPPIYFNTSRDNLNAERCRENVTHGLVTQSVAEG
ncbi:MAG TPA: hypothetical protein VMM81_08780 [Acidimicrobiia bacterium]|nr:hypothetical protein [Acidimicrobiia bacterium]